MSSMDIPSSPESAYPEDPIEDLLNMFRERFREAIVHEGDIIGSSGRHPAMRVFDYSPRGGSFLKKGSLLLDGLRSQKIMLKLPEIDPSNYAETPEQLMETISETGIQARSLAETKVIVYMPSPRISPLDDNGERKLPEDAADGATQFIVRFNSASSDAYYIVDERGIVPFAPDDDHSVDFEVELETLLSDDFEDNDGLSQEDRERLHEAEQKHQAEAWLKLLSDFNLVAFR